MNPLRGLAMPEYVFRPAQIVRRLRRRNTRPAPVEEVALPWGAVLSVHTGENIGSDLYWYGIFDKIIPETIARLLDRGETAIEVGANIGQNCSLMALRSGPGARVLAFEPHPEIAAELRANLARWPLARMAEIQVEQVALGHTPGQAVLSDGPEFSSNRGSASLRSGAGDGHCVRVARLDEYLAGVSSVGVCKIDVEGFELDVLRGAEDALARRVIRDIVFEDFERQPSPVTQHLRRFGYEVMQLAEGWWKPQLHEMGKAPSSAGHYNYLATLNGARARKRFRTPGWRCLMM